MTYPVPDARDSSQVLIGHNPDIARPSDLAEALSKAETAMTPFVKKVAGLGLVLLGGLAVAHGGSAVQTTQAKTMEIVVGLLLIVAGVALLATKIARRNPPVDGPRQGS